MNGSDAVPNFRPNVIVAQCLIGVKMPTVKVLLVPHEGRQGLQPRPGGLLRLSQSRPKPALCGGLVDRWDDSPQDVPG
jgi:hypothetical protein